MTPQTRYNRRKRAWLAATKLARGCEHCGSKKRDPKNLEFHHRDPSTKSFNVSKAAHTVGWSTLTAEVAKCDMLCEKCHKLTPSYGVNGR